MSASLDNTVALLANQAFIGKVRAAVTEHALLVVNDTTGTFPVRTSRVELASVLIYDVDAGAPFLRLCADDDVISAAGVGAVADEDIRRVVAAKWSAVAVTMPKRA